MRTGASLAGLHAAAMSEDELEEQVRDACKKLGVLRIHIRYTRAPLPDVPDDVLIGPRGVLWRELKTMAGQTDPGSARRRGSAHGGRPRLGYLEAGATGSAGAYGKS